MKLKLKRKKMRLKRISKKCKQIQFTQIKKKSIKNSKFNIHLFMNQYVTLFSITKELKTKKYNKFIEHLNMVLASN